MINVRRESGFTILETLFVVGLIGVLSAIAVPMFGGALADFRLSGDARGVANAIAVAKMRAASNFSRVRLFVDITGGTHRLETWDKTNLEWDTEGGTTNLSTGVSFSHGVVAVPPPNSQTLIAQAPACTDDDGNPIGNSACVMFNSRGVPVDSTFAPTGIDAIYLTDGSAVYGVTIAATGMLRLWRTLPVAAPSWMLN